MAEVGGTPGAIMAAERPLSGSLDDWGGRQRLRCPHEHLWHRRRLAERTIQDGSHRVACEGARQSVSRIEWKIHQRVGRRLNGNSLFDRRRDLVARNQKLAAKRQGELAGAHWARQLGSSQRARVLVLSLHTHLGAI